jgi:hypothetical protein
MSSSRLNSAQAQILAHRSLAGFSSWRAVAAFCEFDDTTIWRILTGQTARKSSLKRVADALRISVVRLQQLIAESRATP